MAQVLEKIGAGEGNRTLVISLEGCCSTIELHPRTLPLRQVHSLIYCSPWSAAVDSGNDSSDVCPFVDISASVSCYAPCIVTRGADLERRSGRSAKTRLNSICFAWVCGFFALVENLARTIMISRIFKWG